MKTSPAFCSTLVCAVPLAQPSVQQAEKPHSKSSGRKALDGPATRPKTPLAVENVNDAVKSNLLLSFFESVPDVSARFKLPVTMDRKYEEVVKSAQAAAVLVLVY